MAKLLAVEQCSTGMRNSLLGCLRLKDEAVLLPQCHRSLDSNTFKNIVFRLDGEEPDVPTEIFNPDWFAGISAVQLKPGAIDKILENPEQRQHALRKMTESIVSEASDSSVVVGPSLEADELDRDQAEWVAGLDGPASCVGIYIAEHSCSPDSLKTGINRVHREAFLVCKAGGGVAASTFHSRLVESLKKGVSLESALESGSEPGPKGLRRVCQAASRNRGRILLQAAKALGIDHLMDSIGDSASMGKYRTAVVNFDIQCNTLRKIDGERTSIYQYTAATDALLSNGLATCSNVSDGMVFFFSSTGEVLKNLKNDAHSAIPFGSMRIKRTGDLMTEVSKAHTEAVNSASHAHVDANWLGSRFAWKSKRFQNVKSVSNPEPLSLWGSHQSESFISKFSRELGLANAQVVRLRPELVVLPGIEMGKLRSLLKHLENHQNILNGGDA